MKTLANGILKTGFVLYEKWVIIELIGKGAMGEVYRAHQLNLKRDVAIKVISQEMLQSFEEDPIEIENACQRFRREVQVMARIRHPNVLQIYDYGSETVLTEGKDLTIEYIVMEFIPGATLRYTMAEEGFYPEENLTKDWLEGYFLPLLNGVEAIHAHGIIHRDLKPENVLLDGNIPKIADFGIARSSWLRPVTQSIDVKGTPAYMSPEHFFDLKKTDQQSDIYSLSKILFEAVSGKIPRETIPFKSVRLSQAETPFFKKLDRIIQDSTAEEKEKRPKTIAEFRMLLQEALQLLSSEIPSQPFPKPGRFSFLSQPRFIWAGIILAVSSMLAMGLWHLMSNQETALTAVQETSPGMEDASRSSSKGVEAPPPSLRGKDGIVMHLIPAGIMTIESRDLDQPAGTEIRVSPFYVDETMVTHHHFIEFLNAVKGSLAVRDGIIRQEDRIWFYLGSGTEPHEQILYEQGRFFLRKSEYAAYPVVRVTWYGAQAYADYFGKRLLTEYEWDYGVINNLFAVEAATSHIDMPSPQDVHPHMTPVSPSVEKYDKTVPKEWVTRTDAELDPKGEMKNSKPHNSLVANMISGSGRKAKTYRYPWEAFADVGFRCALSAD